MKLFIKLYYKKLIGIAIVFLTIAIYPPIFLLMLVAASVVILYNAFFTRNGRNAIVKQAKYNKGLKCPADKSICPKCGSDKITVLNDRSAFSFKKALVGNIIVGGLGTFAGLLGNNKHEFMCMKCGHKYK